jgi:hypothetical protein
MMDLHTTAIHEAGHAVAAVRLDIEYGRATIVPDVEAGNLGLVSCDENYFVLEHQDDMGCVSTVSHELVENQLILCLAGYAARIAAGHSEEDSMDGTGKDISDAVELLAKVPSLPLDHWKEKVVALMQRPENVNAVQRVACQLLKDRCLATEEDYEHFIQIHPMGPTGCRSIP